MSGWVLREKRAQFLKEGNNLKCLDCNCDPLSISVTIVALLAS